MYTKKIDKSKSKIGLAVDIIAGEGKTGYQLVMLVRSQRCTFDCSQEIYDFIDEGRFGHYPNVMELFYIPIFDEKGVVIQLLQADRFQNEENCLVDTSFGLATYSMFSYPLTEKTLPVGAFFKLDGSIIKIADDFLAKKEQLVYLEARGAIKDPKNSMMFKMADDFDIYTWDWSQAKCPFSISLSREECIANNFVSGFKVGVPEDVESCYWIWFGSLRGNDDQIDTVCCFKNKAPGWSY